MNKKINLKKLYKPETDVFRRPRKFKCVCCEKIVMDSYEIKTKKNYPFGKNSKPSVQRTHKQCGGVLIKLEKREVKNGT